MVNEEPSSRQLYRNLYKLQQPSDRDLYKGNEKRYTLRNSNYRIDLRPKVFVKMMKVEIILIFFGFAFAICKYLFM
jgi:hypothetical protein